MRLLHYQLLPQKLEILLELMESNDPSAVKEKSHRWKKNNQASTKINLFSQQNKFTMPKTKPMKKAINATSKKNKTNNKEYDPKTPFVQQILQQNLSNKYTPLVCKRDDMEMLTTFGPFDSDTTINAVVPLFTHGIAIQMHMPTTYVIDSNQ